MPARLRQARARSGRLAGVVAEKAPKPDPAADRARRDRVAVRWRRLRNPRRQIAQSLMRPELVVIRDVRLRDVIKLPQRKAEEVIQTLAFQAADPRLREAICLRHHLHPVRAMAMECSASSIPSILTAASSFPS